MHIAEPGALRAMIRFGWLLPMPKKDGRHAQPKSLSHSMVRKFPGFHAIR